MGSKTKIHSTALAFFLLYPTFGFGTSATFLKNTPQIQLDTDSKARSEWVFARSYLAVGAGKNFPVQSGTRHFKSGYLHPIIGYRYVFDDSWMLGVSTQFKILKAHHTGDVVSLFAIDQSSQRLVRLYHPLYLMVGGKILYLLPAKDPVFPVQKNERYTTEVGAGLTASLIYRGSKLFAGGVYLDRWRGTKTRQFQSAEFGFFLARALGK